MRRGSGPVWEWRPSKGSARQDELRVGDRLLATLCWEARPSTRACAEASGFKWTFERTKRLPRHVEVREAGSGGLRATFHPGWTGAGALEWPGGRAFSWTYSNFMQTRWAFFDPAGKRLVRFTDNSTLFERVTTVEVTSEALSPSERALLLPLGRYLMLSKTGGTAMGGDVGPSVAR
jgi:hypothetical protein